MLEEDIISDTRSVPARTCHRIPVKRHRRREKNKLPESDDQSSWHQSTEPSITHDLVSFRLPSKICALTSGTNTDGERISNRRGGRVVFVAMHRTEEKPIVSFVRLGADVLMESLVKFNCRAHGMLATADRIRTENPLYLVF